MSSISDTSRSFTFVTDNSTNELYYEIFITVIAFFFSFHLIIFYDHHEF